MNDATPLPFKLIREKMRKQIYDLTGMKDISGVEVYQSVRLAWMVSRMALNDERESEISGQRWEILMRLLVEEKHGNPSGINPTLLSKARYVQKNTISSLLKGLEEQGFITREVDPKDKRAFRIRLTDEGRRITEEITPVRLQRLNDAASGLSKDEKEQLIRLLAKLTKSIVIKEKLFPKILRGNYDEEN